MGRLTSQGHRHRAIGSHSGEDSLRKPQGARKGGGGGEAREGCPSAPRRERSPGLAWSEEAARRAGWSSHQAQLSSLQRKLRCSWDSLSANASSALDVIVMEMAAWRFCLSGVLLWDANLSQLATSIRFPGGICVQRSTSFVTSRCLLLLCTSHLTSGLLSGLLLKEWGALGRSRGVGGTPQARRRPWEP